MTAYIIIVGLWILTSLGAVIVGYKLGKRDAREKPVDYFQDEEDFYGEW